MANWIKETIANPNCQAMPIMTYPGLEITRRCIPDLILSAENQYQCIKALADRYPSLAALTLMDLSVEAEAFGCPVKFSSEDVPTVSAPIVTDMESAQALQVPAVGAARTGTYLGAARLAADNITDRPVFGGLIGPFSLTVRLRDMTEVMLDLVLQPEIITLLLKKATAYIIDYAKAFKRAGANGIVIAEPAAGLLSKEHCETFSAQYVSQIVEAVQDSHFAVILHNCGNTRELVPTLVATGASGLHFGNAVNMTGIMPQIPPHVLAFGNIDPAGVLRHASPQDVHSATLDLLESVADYHNYALSSGCDIPPGTPLENIDAFFKGLAEYNREGVRQAEGKCA